jgi:hypothetical protein
MTTERCAASVRVRCDGVCRLVSTTIYYYLACLVVAQLGGQVGGWTSALAGAVHCVCPCLVQQPSHAWWSHAAPQHDSAPRKSCPEVWCSNVLGGMHREDAVFWQFCGLKSRHWCHGWHPKDPSQRSSSPFPRVPVLKLDRFISYSRQKRGSLLVGHTCRARAVPSASRQCSFHSAHHNTLQRVHIKTC